MHCRREQGQLRVPSPAPARRQIRPRDTYAEAVVRDDHRDRGFRAREPSPGGIGRLSTSAPSGAADLSTFIGRGHRDHRSPDSFSSSATVSSYHTAASRWTRESSPKNSRLTSSYSHVNGDVTSHANRSRPKSFPDGRGAYLADSSGYHGYVLHPKTGRELSPGYVGRVPSSYDQLSPANSDEAMSSVTMTYERAIRQRMRMEMLEGSFTCDDGYTWHSALTCYLCGQLFRRPRILPCGHTFCSECLAQLKDESLREGRKVPSGHAACTWEGRQKTDVGTQFVCPMPECHYSMRLMNLSRWSTRNKTVIEAVAALRKMYENRQDQSTQTDITMESLLVTIPRSLLQETPPPGGERGLIRRNSTSLVDRMVHRALSMDSLSRNYIPQQHVTWRSYVAMLGMHILQQVIHT